MDAQQISDDDLVGLAAAGDEGAWADLMDRHLSAIVSFAWYRLHDRAEAEDVAQETMLRFSKKVRDWTPGGPQVRSWLYRVAANLCIDRQRAKRPEVPVEDAEEHAVIDLRPHLDGKMDARRVVYKALSALPERQQVVLIMVYYQGHTVREAAEILACDGVAPRPGTADDAGGARTQPGGPDRVRIEMTESKSLSDAQLDAALELLRAPPPSDRLEARVKEFAPAAWSTPVQSVRLRRWSIAAALLLAAGTGAMLHVVLVDRAAPSSAAQATAEATMPPSEEIRPPEIALVDPPVRPQAETISVAILPLD